MAMYFLGTFESADLAQFTSANGSLQSNLPKEDTYGGKNTNNTNFLKNINTDYGLGDIAHTFSGAWFRWDGNLTGSWYVMLGNGAASEQFNLMTNGNLLKIQINGVWYYGTYPLAANTWYFIQVDFYCHDSAGYCKVYIDGLLDITTGTIDSKTGTDTGLRQIKWQGTNDNGVNCYVDNCLFAENDPNFGIKVSKPGKEATSMDSKNLVFNSQMTFFKFHQESTASVTFSPGDKTKTVSVAHNLGYVPAFIAYGVRSDNGATFIIPSIPYGISEFDYAEVWADSTHIYFKVTMFDQYNDSGWNQFKFVGDQIYWEFYGDGVGVVVGNPGEGGKSTAFRFPSVYIPRNRSLVSATLNINQVFSGPTNGDTKYKIWGIDEDNVGDVDLGKAKTDAYDARNQSKVSGFWNFGTDVKDQVAEIIARSGWNEGNNMGFILNDDGSDSGKYIGGTGSTNTLLDVIFTGDLTVSFRVIVFKDKIAD